MKKLKVYILSVCAACGIVLSAQAIPPMPPGPVDPVIDVSNDAVFYLQVGTGVMSTAVAQANTFIENAKMMAMSAVSSLVGKFKGFMGGMFKKKKKENLPGTKGIQESKIADIYDPTAVKAALYPMFFQYPADCGKTTKKKELSACENYNSTAREFYQDTIIEIYGAVRELEKSIPELEASINAMSESLASGGDGAEDPNNGDNAALKNLYNAYETMSGILKIMEEVQAMRAQMVAAQAIGARTVLPAKPIKKSKKKDKKAAVNEDIFLPVNQAPIKLAVAGTQNRTSLSFADVADDDEEITYSTVSFVAAPASGNASPFDGNKEDLAALEQLTDANNYVQEALEVHNTIKGLKGYRTSFEMVGKYKKLHDKAVESLKQTEQCAINYFGYMYENPKKMWNGNLPENRVTDFSARKGISGWMVNAYNLAKAEDTELVVDADDLPEMQTDTSDVDAGDMDAATNKVSGRMSKPLSFKDASKSSKVNQSMKESEKVVWNIGSEATKMLATDQLKNGKNGKWGTAKDVYPIWQDLKSYYTQYIKGKYDSIIKRLDLINTNELAFSIASKLIDRADTESERKFYALKLNELKAKIEKDKGEVGSSIDQLVAEKKNKLNSIYQVKENQMAVIKNKEDKINQQINKIQAQIDDLSVRRRNAEEEQKEAETTISVNEVLIDQLLKQKENIDLGKVLKKEEKVYKKELQNTSVVGKQSYNLYQGTYSLHQTLANAQISIDLKAEKELQQKSLKDDNVKVYTEEVITLEDAEEDEETISRNLEEARLTLAYSREKVLELKQEIINLNKKIEELSAQKTELQNEIKTTIAAEKNAVNEKYVQDSNAVTFDYDAKIAQEETRYAAELAKFNNIDLKSYFEKNFTTNITSSASKMYRNNFLNILSNSNALVNDTKSAAKEIIEQTVQDILSLDEELYKPAQHGKVVEYHKNLMNTLKKLPVQNLKDFSQQIKNLSSVTSIMNALSTIYQSYMTNDACIHDYCNQADVAYYISNNGKRRDFLAPCVTPQEALPSVREAIYFDYTDYDVIPKTKQGALARQDILGYLTYAPDIWKKILTYPAYMEKDIDLSAVIKPSVDKMQNSGLYPCWYGDYLVTSNGEKYVVYSKKISSVLGASAETSKQNKKKEELLKLGYNQCQNIKISGSSTYPTVKNIAEDVQGQAESKAYTDFKRAQTESELGYLFKYDKGEIKYNDPAGKMYKEQSEANSKGDGTASQKVVLSDYASLVHSQTGEFLKSLDVERQFYKSLQEMKLEVEKAKKVLFDLFAKSGFVPSSDFDLSRDSDYNLAKETLLRYRNKVISSANGALGKVKETDSEVVNERLKKLQKVIKALKKDSSAYVALSDESEDNAELDASIKTEKANENIANKQKQQSEEAFEKQLKEIGKVFCMQLIDNI